MTVKDFCRVAWEELKVVRLKPYALYYEFKDTPFDIYPVIQNFPRDYDSLGINWEEIDFSEPIQKIGQSLYNKYRNVQE